ncbi:zinc ribbon domain-containing protein [Bifidobacterium callitrichos]|nr:zinc ribbon domain-containing protein [Bifidobacterium callitrichos]
MEGNEGNTFCINCGAKLRDNAKFCPKCGVRRFVPTEAATVPAAPIPTPTPVTTIPPIPEPLPTTDADSELPVELAHLLKAAQSGVPSGNARPTTSEESAVNVPVAPAAPTGPTTGTTPTPTATVSASTPTASSTSSDESRGHLPHQWSSTTEAPKKSGGFWDKLTSLFDGVFTVKCVIFGLIYLIGGIVVAFSEGYWAGLLASLYGVYLLWPSDHVKLLIW